jgi:hypothetical protein
MKLNNAGISILKGNKAIKKRIMAALVISLATMYRYIKDNDENLTKASVLAIIREETGLADEQILEAEEQAKA